MLDCIEHEYANGKDLCVFFGALCENEWRLFPFNSATKPRLEYKNRKYADFHFTN